MSTVTKPIALDETLQSTNTALGSLGKDTTLQAIATAIANVGLSNIGNMSSLATTDKTSLVSAINEVVGDVSDLDTDKADKVTSATNGNLAGLNASGNLTDSGWNGAKTTTSASGNPISITGLKSNQLAVNPVITFEPIQAGSGDPSPSNVRAISGYDEIEVLSCGKNICDNSKNKVGGYYNLIGQWVENSGFASTGLIPVAPNTQYRGHIYDKNGNALNDIVWTKWSNETTCEGQVTDAYITTGADTRFVRLRNYSNESSYITNNNFLFALEKGNTSSTTYPAYHKTTDLSEPLPQTVYGGSLDVRSGKFIITKICKDLGDLEWTYQHSRFFSTSLVASVGGENNGSTYKNVIFSCYKNSILTANGNAFIYYTDKYLYLYDSRYTDATTFKTAIAGQTVCYELATPTEIQLTPHEISLLKDYAYVSTNGTSIALDYHNGEIATLGDVEQLSATVEEFTSKFITVFGTTADTVNVEKMIPLPDGVDYSKFVLLGYTALNKSNNVWYSNPTFITIFTTAEIGYGIRVTSSSNAYLSTSIKIFGVLVA